jgi:cyclohexa-1,5-dienecarbonyl-CoA hydratase
MFRVEKKTDHATIFLERPPLNILNIEMMEGLVKTLRVLAKEKDLKILVFEGSEKAFSAGVDVTEHQGDKVRVMIRSFHRLIEKVESFPLPTLAVVQGMALGGGCEFVAACDFILAENNAKFGLPEISLGVFPPFAALRLPELIGSRMAKKIIYSGKLISATEAERIGLISGAFSSTMLRSEVENLINSMIEKSGAALRILKRALKTRNLKAIENLYLNELMKTHDAEEGLSAFMEKRKPVWKNK